MTSNTIHIWNWQYTRRFLRLWLPLILILAAVLWLLYRTQIDAVLTVTLASEKQSIQLAERTINAELSLLRGDALYLAEHTSLQKWLDTGLSESRQQLSTDLLNFARQRGLYDQIRFIDVQGQELVRINWNQGQPQAVPASELQIKADRYYVRNTLGLSKNTVYISPFDLNIEDNFIEQPIKPMIRLGTPVFDHLGRKRGLIVMNYLGQRLLDRLRAIPSESSLGLWLLNAEGYWLLGPQPEMEWGFMYPDRKDIRFAQQYPDIWSLLKNEPRHDQQLRQQGLITYAGVSPTGVIDGTDHKGWILLSHVSAATLASKMAKHVRNLSMTFLALALLLALLSGLIAYQGERRRQNEAMIRSNETRFRSLLDSAPDALVIVDKHGHIILTNIQAENWFGYSREELLGQPVEKLVPERFREAHIPDRDHYLSAPSTRAMGRDVELYGLRKNGSEFPVEISLSPVKTEQGILVTSIIRDITARKQIEEAQRQVQARYQELVNNLPVGVYRNTPGVDGHFLEVNPAMLDIFEATSRKQLLAHPVSDLYCDPDARLAFSDKILRKGHATSEELLLKTLQGREFYAALTTVMTRDDNDEIYFDGIIEDISARKKSEHRIQQLNDSLRARSTELEVINHELESFSYSVSHDLRTPLRAIDGFSRTLLDDYGDLLDDRGRNRLDRIRAAAQRMAALIDDLLKLSRVSRVELTRKPVDLTQLANKVMETLQQGEPERALQFTVQSDLVAQGDVHLLQVVLDNLLGNAWKFTSQCPEAVIDIGSKTEGDEYIYFVRDNGAGFDMAYADKLFGAFQRLHDAKDFPGTGIGLATVQRVIHKHGGRIWSESAVDQGATFYFTLS